MTLKVNDWEFEYLIETTSLFEDNMENCELIPGKVSSYYCKFIIPAGEENQLGLEFKHSFYPTTTMSQWIDNGYVAPEVPGNSLDTYVANMEEMSSRYSRCRSYQKKNYDR